MIPSSSLSRRFIPYFNDTRFDRGIFKTEDCAKGAWLLGFVRLGGFGGLDMRFLGENGERKNQIPIRLRSGQALRDDKNIEQRQERQRLNGWWTVYIPPFRKSAKGWGTRA
jgi:hypothetical protein